MAQFDVGDFILYADVWQHNRAKLRVKEAHASRLNFYADNSSLAVTEDLLRHVAHNSEGHVVDTFLSTRYNTNEKRHELLVHWRGLDTVEDSWEPATVLLQDVPVAVKAFVRSHQDDGAM
ncbi:hypothetical protein F443_22918 [Phytophthora nicotianae P1569]|uniref:Chromo domain-containing protein n=1 Tax=Phytophthora nicotianae P1569 TaxID=1317065 RepID=V9DUH0_PHYNI|nr:hypothetical protein F443_22918 [Phytophthora nicotianae P1569]